MNIEFLCKEIEKIKFDVYSVSDKTKNIKKERSYAGHSKKVLVRKIIIKGKRKEPDNILYVQIVLHLSEKEFLIGKEIKATKRTLNDGEVSLSLKNCGIIYCFSSSLRRNTSFLFMLQKIEKDNVISGLSIESLKANMGIYVVQNTEWESATAKIGEENGTCKSDSNKK